MVMGNAIYNFSTREQPAMKTYTIDHHEYEFRNGTSIGLAQSRYLQTSYNLEYI